MKIYFSSTNYSFEPAIFLKQDGSSKQVNQLTLSNSIISNVECNLCTQSQVMISHVHQSTLVHFNNFTIQNYANQTNKTAQSPVVIKSFQTSWTAPWPTIKFSDFKCIKSFSITTACIKLIVSSESTVVSNEHFIVNNSLFKECESTEGAIYYEEGILSFLTQVLNTVFNANRETKAWWSADIAVNDVTTPNVTFKFKNCSFLNSFSDYGWSTSFQILSLHHTLFLFEDVLFDCKNTLKYTDKKK